MQENSWPVSKGTRRKRVTRGWRSQDVGTVSQRGVYGVSEVLFTDAQRFTVRAKGPQVVVLKLSSRFLHPPSNVLAMLGAVSESFRVVSGTAPPAPTMPAHPADNSHGGEPRRVGTMPSPPPPAPYANLHEDPADRAQDATRSTSFDITVSDMARKANDAVWQRHKSASKSDSARKEGKSHLVHMDRPFRAKDHVASDLFHMFTLPAAQNEAANAQIFDKAAPPLTAQECERVLKKMMYVWDQRRMAGVR